MQGKLSNQLIQPYPPPPPITPPPLPLARATAPQVAEEEEVYRAAPSPGRCQSRPPAGPDDEIELDCGQKMEDSSIRV